MMTFDEFMTTAMFPNAAYVKCKGWSSFYVKKGRRYLRGELHDNILVLSNIEAKKTGQGTLTKFIVDFRAKYPGIPIMVECVLVPRFAEGLLRRGFRQCEHDFQSYYLLPDDEFICHPSLTPSGP